jgi:hypothetical protein
LVGARDAGAATLLSIALEPLSAEVKAGGTLQLHVIGLTAMENRKASLRSCLWSTP